jgi:hypothetical protein
MSTKYIATHLGVTIGKRTTENRTYTHAIVVLPQGAPAPRVVSWAGRLDLAEKEARVWRKRHPEVWIVAAEEVS